MKFAEQIKAFELTLKGHQDRQAALMSLAGGEGRTLDDEEEKEFDSLTTEVAKISQHVKRLKDLEAADAGAAAPVPAAIRAPGARLAPAIHVRNIKDADEKFAGQMFTRRAIARALSYIDPDRRSPGDIAAERWGKTSPQLVEVIKAGVAGGGTGSGEWGAELVQADARYTGDFIEFLYSKTVFDKCGLFNVPPHVTIKGQDGTATGTWVGESKSIPVSAQDYSTVSLTPLKVAAISVVSKEILKHSSPAAEELVRNSLVNACAQRVDTTFVSTTAASAGVSPAGILNGLTSLGSNGYTEANLRQDIAELYAPFIAAKYDTMGFVLVMHPSLAKSISLMVNALGQTSFPTISAEGGTLFGDKVVTGHNVTSSHIILLDPRNIWRIEGDGIEVSVSDQATLEQDTAPAGASDTPTAASATIMSMFGTDSVAFKVVRPINYAKRRTTAVAFIADAGYGNPNWVTS